MTKKTKPRTIVGFILSLAALATPAAASAATACTFTIQWIATDWAGDVNGLFVNG